jgi:hypothetical protein
MIGLFAASLFRGILQPALELLTLPHEGIPLTEGVWRMRRLFLGCLLAILVAASVATQPSFAQDSAAILAQYQLVPRLSTLHETGGFAGLDVNYRLFGDYGFGTGISSTATASAGVRFIDPDIWGAIVSNGPTPDYVIDVDQLLNLAGLQGKAVPSAAPFGLYEFQGKTSDGSSINLFASTLGPWMYLRGSTQPPAGSADYFTYQLRALAHKGPFADLNADGVVDASDYALLRKSGVAGGTDAATGASVADWRQQFGETLPDLNAMDAMITAAAGSGLASSSVPEPACMVLAIFGSIVVATLRHHRRG